MNFFARFKKLFLLLGFLVVTVLIGYFLWRFFFQTEGETTTPVASGTPGVIGEFPSVGPNSGIEVIPGGSGQLPFTPSGQTPGSSQDAQPGTVLNPSEIALGGVTKTTTVNDNPSLDLAMTNSGQVQYYDRTDGKFYKLNSDGTKTTLSDKIFHSVSAVTWSPTSDKAVIEYPDGSKISYNFTTQKQATLPSHWQDFSFSTAGDKLVSKSIGLNEADSWLVVSNDDGSQAKALEKIGAQYPNVHSAWSPNNQMVAFYTEGVDFNRQEVFFVGLNGENFKSTQIEGRGIQAQWSDEGDRLLYSVYSSTNNYNPSLWVVNASSDTIGQNRTPLNLQTWADKCTFASNTEVYCAVPDSLERGAGLFPELADSSQDSLYKIDLTTGSKKLIAVPDSYYNISQIVVGDNQDYLYFTDKYSGSIHQVRLR